MSASDIGKALADLVAFTSKVEWTDIPKAVQMRAALVLSDDMAAMIAARGEPEVVALHEPLAWFGQAEATVGMAAVGG